MKINILDFLKERDRGYSEAFFQAVEYAKTIPAGVKKTLYFPKGIYDFYADYSPVREVYVSNTCGPQHQEYKNKHIAILLEGAENITVDGNGSEFIMHGDITTFAALNCHDIVFKNFVLDHASPSVVDIVVEKAEDHTVEISIPDCYIYEISPDKKDLIWKGEASPVTGKPYWEGKNNLVYNQKYMAKTGRTWRGDTRKCEVFEDVETIEEIKKGLLRITLKEKVDTAIEGICYQMRNIMRTTPGALIAESKNITTKNVRVKYFHGFGLVGQMSKNLFFRDCTFVPPYETGRTTAGFADYLHLSSIGGKVEVTGCRFENSHDDPINLHGTFLQVMEVLDKENTEFLLRYMHHETGGFAQYYIGNTVEFSMQDTLVTLKEDDGIAQRVVVAVENNYKNDKRLIKIKLSAPLLLDQTNKSKIEGNNGLNYVVENVTYTASLLVRDCVFEKIPTRGILVTTRKDVLIENNLFKNLDMAGISISCDGSNWYESGRTKNVIIRNNRFLELTTMAVFICPTAEGLPGDRIHKRILVENNEFHAAKEMKEPFVHGWGVEELIVR